MAQFSEFATTIPSMDNGHKQATENGKAGTPVAKPPKLPKQAGGIDRLLDSIGFYGLDRVTYKNLRLIVPSEQRKDETCQQLHYACNQCPYQGLTFDHVFVHQACVHPGNFTETLQNRIAGMGTKNTKFEELKDVFDNLPIAPTSNGTKEEPCKIIRVSNGNDLKQDSPSEHFLKFGIHGKVQPGHVRCAFCSTPEKDVEQIWFHFVGTHPMSPFLAMSSNRDWQLSKNEERSLEEIYYEFFTKIADRGVEVPEEPKEPEVKSVPSEVITQEQPEVNTENVEAASTEETSNPESVQTPDRKRKFDEVEQEEEVKEDGSVQVQPEEAPAQKRGRFDIVKNVARRSVNFLGTVAVAVGVYHLSHYLPQPIQAYLE